MTQALDSLDRKELHRTVDYIKERQKIYVFGLGPSMSLVTLLEIRLRRFGKDVVALRSSGREVLDQLLGMGPDDVLFAICFFDLNPDAAIGPGLRPGSGLPGDYADRHP